MEHTLILIKPDGVKRGLIGKIISYFEKEEMRLAGVKMIKLDDVLLNTWYSHHKDKPFFHELKDFMKQTPVVAVVLEGANVVARVRDICGPTDSAKAPKGTVRGDLGLSVQENVIHASDSIDRATEELQLLFGEGEVFDYRL